MSRSVRAPGAGARPSPRSERWEPFYCRIGDVRVVGGAHGGSGVAPLTPSPCACPPPADEGEHDAAAASAGYDNPADGLAAEKAAMAPVSKLSVQALPIRAYLDQTVVPLLLQGLNQLVKER